MTSNGPTFDRNKADGAKMSQVVVHRAREEEDQMDSAVLNLTMFLSGLASDGL